MRLAARPMLRRSLPPVEVPGALSDLPLGIIFPPHVEEGRLYRLGQQHLLDPARKAVLYRHGKNLPLHPLFPSSRIEIYQGRGWIKVLRERREGKRAAKAQKVAARRSATEE